MNALVKKEIRLLLPAWIVALLLILAPIPLSLMSDVEDNSVFMLTAVGVALGCIMLGLAGFGREVTSGTFSLLLAQPRPRRPNRSPVRRLGSNACRRKISICPLSTARRRGGFTRAA